MKVHNINVTKQKVCKCGSWLDHWKNFSKRPVRKYCPVKNCLDKNLYGALVQKADADDINWYIIPLCSAHGKSSRKSLEIFDALKLIPANIKETCSKNLPETESTLHI